MTIVRPVSFGSLDISRGSRVNPRNPKDVYHYNIIQLIKDGDGIVYCNSTPIGCSRMIKNLSDKKDYQIKQIKEGLKDFFGDKNDVKRFDKDKDEEENNFFKKETQDSLRKVIVNDDTKVSVTDFKGIKGFITDFSYCYSD